MSRDKAIELAEEYLRSYEDIKVHIEILEEEKKVLAEMIATLPAIEYDSVKVQASATGNPTEQNAMSLLEKSLYIDSDLKNSRLTIYKIDRALNELNEIQKKVVYLTLIKNYNWNNVSYRLGYSERQLRRIRAGAVYKFATILFGPAILGKDVRKMSDF